MNHVLSANLKKFRLSKQLTQEQAAEALCVSVQTVSRWECGTSLPDVVKLPEIARFYCVTIDDLFRDAAVAYENYAQRLSSEYEGIPNYRKLCPGGAGVQTGSWPREVIPWTTCALLASCTNI